jgi:predicted MFS family arabinose efflux permease
LVCGWLLKQVVFPFNYQLVFGLGLMGIGISTIYVARLKTGGAPPRRIGAPLQDLGRPSLLRIGDAVRQAPGLRFLLRSQGRRLLRLDLLRGPFGPFILSYLLFYTAQFAPIPILPLYWVNDLGLADSTISIGNAIFQSTLFLASLVMPMLALRWGVRWLMVGSALLYGAYPLINALAGGPELFLVASISGGAVWGLASVSLATRLFERVPADDRPAHMALYNLALNFGSLSGSLVGTLLAGWLGLREALLISAALRLVAGFLLWRWG